MSGDNSLWRQVLKCKYARNNSQKNEVNAKAYYSSLWKDIVNVWFTKKDISFQTIGNGEMVKV